MEHSYPHDSSAQNLTAGKWHTGIRNTIRNHFIAMLGEFCGTLLFLFFSFAPAQIAVTAIKGASGEGIQLPSPPDLLYIASAFGASLAVNVWIFYRISGGMLNPAVTLGLCLIGAVPPIRGLLLFPCQMLGGIAASGVVSALFPGPLIIGVRLGGGTSITQGLFIEMFLTAQLIIVIMMLAVEKHRATFLAPLGIGLSLFIAHLAGIYFTGAGINPARAFGPDVINRGFPGYHWIYWLGPFLGSFLAAACYHVFKLLGYQTANPGQDSGKELIGLLYFDEESAFEAHGDQVKLLHVHSKRLVTEQIASPNLVRPDVFEVQRDSTAKGPNYSVEMVSEETAPEITRAPGN